LARIGCKSVQFIKQCGKARTQTLWDVYDFYNLSDLPYSTVCLYSNDTCPLAVAFIVCIFSLPQVEMLVMKALSLGLVKGSIDEIDQKVHMTWVQPRVLDLQQVSLK
jgi:hypothetical protein